VIQIRSYAKVNLGLEVVGKRPDHYHEIRTLFQTVGLFDILEFRRASGHDIELSGTDSTILWGNDNLVYRAASLLWKHSGSGSGISIHVTKNIPAGRGLGGGSSNAAVTLHALNKLWGLNYTRAELALLGCTLGADVPYFLTGGLCLGIGRGDEIKPLQDLPLSYCVLVLPDVSISTADVYANFPTTLTSRGKDSKIIRFLDNPDISGLDNDLEQIVLSSFPQIKAIKSLFRKWKPGLSLMSGSGSAVFGIFQQKQYAEMAFEELKRKYRVSIVETLSREQYWKSLEAGV
jgi:4-diphosphocytidyl-2-C-methyl-D-erythritol kinase